MKSSTQFYLQEEGKQKVISICNMHITIQQVEKMLLIPKSYTTKDYPKDRPKKAEFFPSEKNHIINAIMILSDKLPLILKRRVYF